MDLIKRILQFFVILVAIIVIALIIGFFVYGGTR
ncbi:hypothetical protein SAMN04488589_0972 [Methanolobus vulcani]|uniref:Uncharacterized protein n=1 Tax=Methanolobus vulcani TaxID=38026 RepID=A0A7Z7AVK9_9EURY|nr:hypothetical protein SAMN04488589_0972 [Methanolobus vulcani]